MWICFHVLTLKDLLHCERFVLRAGAHSSLQAESQVPALLLQTHTHPLTWGSSSHSNTQQLITVNNCRFNSIPSVHPLTCLSERSLWWSGFTSLSFPLTAAASASPPQHHHPQIPRLCSFEGPQGLAVDKVTQRCAVDGQDLVPLSYGAFLGCNTRVKHLVNLQRGCQR